MHHLSARARLPGEAGSGLGSAPVAEPARTGGTAEGYRHEVGFYGSNEEFADLVLPFAHGGLDTGEPVVFAYDPYKTDLLHQWLPESPGLSYITDAAPYATPARALAGWRKVVLDHLDAGARRVRIAGNVPHPGYGQDYAGWDRYEAAIDRSMGDLPVWAPCLYDTRIAPADVLETAERRHRQVLCRDGTHRQNAAFRPPHRLAEFLPAPTEPLAGTAPALQLLDPTPAQVRAAVRRLVGDALGVEQGDHLVLAASEVTTNALLHGVPPVRVRIWLGEGRAVIDVHDEGEGPLDPLAGLVRPRRDDHCSGRGLWLAHRLDIDVALIAAGDGFSVRIRAGKDPDA